MKQFNVMLTRERHYLESCEVEVCAADEDEAREKALTEAEEDGFWEWSGKLDGEDNTYINSVVEIEADEEEYDSCTTSWTDRQTPAPVIDYRALAVGIERKETRVKRGEMPVDR